MSADPNKKSARTFQCRDVLWETFEQMARELECSIDYLINESMKQYARQRSYSPRTPFPGPARPDGAPGGSGQHPAVGQPGGPPPPMPSSGPMPSSAPGTAQGMPPPPPPPAFGAGAPPPMPPQQGPPPYGGGAPQPPPMMGGSGMSPPSYGAPP